MTTFKEEIYEKTGIQDYDSCEAVVIGGNSCGCYVGMTDSKIPVQSFVYGGYHIGDKLLVSVRINEPKRRISCKVDSVISYASDEIERSSAFDDVA